MTVLDTLGVFESGGDLERVGLAVGLLLERVETVAVFEDVEDFVTSWDDVVVLEVTDDCDMAGLDVGVFEGISESVGANVDIGVSVKYGLDDANSVRCDYGLWSEERVEVCVELADAVTKAPILTSIRGSPSGSISAIGCDPASVNNIKGSNLILLYMAFLKKAPKTWSCSGKNQ